MYPIKILLYFCIVYNTVLYHCFRKLQKNQKSHCFYFSACICRQKRYIIGVRCFMKNKVVSRNIVVDPEIIIRIGKVIMNLRKSC